VVLLALFLAATLPSPQVAYVRHGTLNVFYVNAGVERPIVEHVPAAPVGIRTHAGHGTLMIRRGGTATRLADVGTSENFYGHYDWARRVAVWP
jgi:hypothetical protein